MIYIFFMIIFFLILNYKKDKLNKGIYIFYNILIVLFLGFSYKMGSDWLEYQKIYENKNNLNAFSFEIGYVYLSAIFNRLNIGYDGFQSIIISIYVIMTFKVFEKYKNRNLFLSIYVYLCLGMMVISFEPILRQILSITIFLFSFKYIEKKKFFCYFILILLATLFHKSALLLIPVYFLNKVDIKLKVSIYILILEYVFFKYFFLIYRIIKLVIPRLGVYEAYIYSQRYGIIKGINIKHEIIVIITILIFIYFVYQDKIDIENRKYIKNMAIIYIYIYVLSTKIPIFYRITYYFMPAFCLSISASVQSIRKNIYYCSKIKLLYIFFIFTIYAGRVLTSSELNRFRYLEYKNYFVEYLKGNVEDSYMKKSFEYKKNLGKLLTKQKMELK